MFNPQLDGRSPAPTEERTEALQARDRLYWQAARAKDPFLCALLCKLQVNSECARPRFGDVGL